MRGILIDPWLKTVTEVDCGEGIESIYRMLSNPLGPKVDLFTIGMNWRNGDTLYVDDEGLLKRGMRLFGIGSKPLAGNGLILGSTTEGHSKDADFYLLKFNIMFNSQTW